LGWIDSTRVSKVEETFRATEVRQDKQPTALLVKPILKVSFVGSARLHQTDWYLFLHAGMMALVVVWISAVSDILFGEM
jgi:hypothetical protein